LPFEEYSWLVRGIVHRQDHYRSRVADEVTDGSDSVGFSNSIAGNFEDSSAENDLR
jgi:hypothetical protein